MFFGCLICLIIVFKPDTTSFSGGLSLFLVMDLAVQGRIVYTFHVFKFISSNPLSVFSRYGKIVSLFDKNVNDQTEEIW